MGYALVLQHQQSYRERLRNFEAGHGQTRVIRGSEAEDFPPEYLMGESNEDIDFRLRTDPMTSR